MSASEIGDPLQGLRRRAGFLVVVIALLLTTLLSTFLVSSVSAEVVDLEPGDTTSAHRFSAPESVQSLTDDNFDAYVYAKRERPQAWFVFIFAPWCEHCKALIPQFFNASLILDHEIKYPHARFAAVNSAKSPKLTERFHVRSFPALIYTTGDGRSWHAFQGGHSTDSFIEFAVYLQRAVDAGSFADDVSDVRKFASADAESGAFRVPFYVFVPSESTSTKENQRTAGWSIGIDGAASIGNVRFGVIYERDLDPAWREEGSAAFVEAVEGAMQCKAKGLANGPAGEVLVSRSDRFRTPQCFSGEWLTPAGQQVKVGGKMVAEPPRLSPLLEKYITVNGFRAVEELNSGMLSILSKQKMNFLGLIVVDGPLDQSDRNMLPVIREMVQSANEKIADFPTEEALSAPQISWAYIDGVMYSLWRSRYGINANEMPAFLLVDTVRNRMYRTRTRLPEFEKIKRDVPWAIDGPQRRMLESFVSDVFAGKYWGEKRSIVGTIAERIAYFRVPGWLYRRLGYDEFIFLVVMFAGFFFSFLMFIAVVAEPWMERRLEAQRTKDVALKKKTQ